MDLRLGEVWHYIVILSLILVRIAESQTQHVIEMCDNIDGMRIRKGVLINAHPKKTDVWIICMCRIIPYKDTRQSEHGLTIIPSQVVLARTANPNQEGMSICPYPEDSPCTTNKGYIRHSNPDHSVTLDGSNLKFTKVDIAYYWMHNQPTGPNSRGVVKIGFEADYDLLLACTGNISNSPSTTNTPLARTTKQIQHGDGNITKDEDISSTHTPSSADPDDPDTASKEFPVTELALAIVIPLCLVLLVGIIATVLCCRRRSRFKEQEQHVPTQNFYVNDIDLAESTTPNMPNLNRLGMAVYYNHSAGSLKIQPEDLQSSFSEENSLYGKRTPPHVNPNKYLPYNMEFSGSFGTVYEDMGSQNTFSNMESIYNEIREVEPWKNNERPKATDQRHERPRTMEDMYTKPDKKAMSKLNIEPTGFKFYDRKTIHGNMIRPSL